MAKILITDPLSDKGIKILEDAGFEVIYKPKPSDEELNAVIGDVNGWIIRSGTTITADHLKNAKNLQKRIVNIPSSPKILLKNVE